MSVGKLASGFPISRPAVSQHLGVLKKAGLVRDNRAGNRRLYELDVNGLRALQAYFERFWSHALGAFKNIAEQSDQGDSRGK